MPKPSTSLDPALGPLSAPAPPASEPRLGFDRSMCARNAVGMQRRTELHRPQMQPFPPLTAAQRLTVGLQGPRRGESRCCRTATQPAFF